jgi:hypothetical protein
MGERRGTTLQGLIGVAMASLLMTACAAGNNARPRWSASGAVDARCGALVEDLSYARKSIAGRVVGTVIVSPIGIGLGAIGAMYGMPHGFALPAMAIDDTVKAVQENREQFGRIRDACLRAGGPEDVRVASAIGGFARLRLHQRTPEDAVRLYRDGVALLERTGEEELDGATSFRLTVAPVMGEYPANRAEAAAVYARTLAALEAGRGSEYPGLVDILEPYARLLRTLGRDEEAESLETRAVAIRTAMTAASASAAAPEAPCDDPAAEPCTK